MNITGDLLIQLPLLGFDSLVAGLMLGPAVQSWRLRAELAGLFGSCDGAAVLLGALLPHRVPDLPDAVLYAFVAIAVVLAARHSIRWLLLAPIILSVDNLASGAPASAAPALGFSSAAMALAGMAVSTAAVRAGLASLRRRRAARDAGAP